MMTASLVQSKWGYKSGGICGELILEIYIISSHCGLHIFGPRFWNEISNIYKGYFLLGKRKSS